MIRCIKDDDFLIQNNLLKSDDELLQAVHFLLRTDSPYATLATSLVAEIGSDLELAKSEARVRINNMATLLKVDYNVERIIIQDLSLEDDGTSYKLDLLFLLNDGTARKETVYA